MKTKIAAAIALVLTLCATAASAGPLDAIASQVNEQVGQSGQDLAQRAVERIAEGNISKESISNDLNATKEELKTRAVAKIEQEINNTTQQVSQRAIEEVRKQADQMEQPGFDMISALTGITAIACLLMLRRSI